MGNVCVFSSISITREKTAKPMEWAKPGKLVPSNILQNAMCVENLGNWYSYFSHSIGAFSIILPSYGILHRMGNEENASIRFLSGCFSTVRLFVLVAKSGNSLKGQTEKTGKVNSFF